MNTKRELKAGKSCGEDGIVPEVLKWVPIDDLILSIINKAYTSHELPAQWTTSNIVRQSYQYRQLQGYQPQFSSCKSV
jgi:hypothetical protein